MNPDRNEMVWFRRPNTLGIVAYIGWARNFQARRGGMYKHSHPDCVEVTFVEAGRMEWRTPRSTIDLHPGDAILTLAHEAHGAVDDDLQPCSFYWLHVPEANLPGPLREALHAPRLERRRTKGELGELVKRVMDEHIHPKPHSDLLVTSLVTELLIGLLRAEPRSKREAGTPWGEQAINLMRAHSGDNLSIELIAREMGISVAWLHRRFLKEFGEPPAKWFREERLSDAKQRLAGTTDSVSYIAAELGFPSSQYFATFFRKETGLTPSAYRKRQAARPAGSRGLRPPP